MAEKSENGAKDYLFSAAERDAIHDEVNKYLNSTTRELLPNEERLIKRVAHGYNILVTTVAIILGSGVIIAALTYIGTTIKNRVAQGVEKVLKQEIESRVNKIKQEIETFSNSFDETKNKLKVNDMYFSDKQKEINTKMNEVVSSGQKLDETKNKAATQINKVEELMLNMERYDKLGKDYKNLFEILDKTKGGQFLIEAKADRQQYIFRVGVLQVLWGLGRTRADNEWTDIRFARSFADPERVFVSVSSNWRGDRGDGEADEKAFVQTGDITQYGFKCKLIRRRLLAHEIQKGVAFKFLAIGQIDAEASQSAH